MKKLSKKHQSVDSNLVQDRVVDIHEMASSATEQHLAQSYINLEKKAIGLSQTIELMTKALDEKDAEIAHLKQLLNSSVPLIGESNIATEATDEELIASLQLRKLVEAGRIRELTLDEIRKFDLLVKNKRLAKGDATEIKSDKKDKKFDKPQLLKLASKKMVGEK